MSKTVKKEVVKGVFVGWRNVVKSGKTKADGSYNEFIMAQDIFKLEDGKYIALSQDGDFLFFAETEISLDYVNDESEQYTQGFIKQGFHYEKENIYQAFNNLIKAIEEVE